MDGIRRATPAEAARLTEIAHAAKRHWAYPEAWIASWREQLTISGEYVETRHVEVAESDGAIAGFVAVSHDGGVAELDHLWVDPAYIGGGLGRRLLERAAAFCRRSGIARIEIDSDPHAEAFYVHMGARRIGKTPAPADGAPDRYLPRLALDVGLADAV